MGLHRDRIDLSIPISFGMIRFFLHDSSLLEPTRSPAASHAVTPRSATSFVGLCLPPTSASLRSRVGRAKTY